MNAIFRSFIHGAVLVMLKNRTVYKITDFIIPEKMRRDLLIFSDYDKSSDKMCDV